MCWVAASEMGKMPFSIILRGLRCSMSRLMNAHGGTAATTLNSRADNTACCAGYLGFNSD